MSDLSAERLRQVVDYDPLTGAFTRAGKYTGRPNSTGYNQIFVDGKRYAASRLAWLYVMGRWPAAQMDHINRDQSDDRWCNLREATPSQNNMNRGYPNNLAPGVTRRGDRFLAQIAVDHKKHHLGVFRSVAEAAAAYAAAKAKIAQNGHKILGQVGT